MPCYPLGRRLYIIPNYMCNKRYKNKFRKDNDDYLDPRELADGGIMSFERNRHPFPILQSPKITNYFPAAAFITA